MIISVDFDGCIVEDAYPGVGSEIPGAITTINYLYNLRHCIIINSCRAREQEDEMKQWLDSHGVKYCHINENCRERISKYRTDCRKISADCYIDDKGIGGMLSWAETLVWILQMFGWYQTRQCQKKMKE
jgi:hypothetical protein